MVINTYELNHVAATKTNDLDHWAYAELNGGWCMHKIVHVSKVNYRLILKNYLLSKE